MDILLWSFVGLIVISFILSCLYLLDCIILRGNGLDEYQDRWCKTCERFDFWCICKKDK